jgi:hypothetical protein
VAEQVQAKSHLMNDSLFGGLGAIILRPPASDAGSKMAVASGLDSWQLRGDREYVC